MQRKGEIKEGHILLAVGSKSTVNMTVHDIQMTWSRLGKASTEEVSFQMKMKDPKKELDVSKPAAVQAAMEIKTWKACLKKIQEGLNHYNLLVSEPIVVKDHKNLETALEKFNLACQSAYQQSRWQLAALFHYLNPYYMEKDKTVSKSELLIALIENDTNSWSIFLLGDSPLPWNRFTEVFAQEFAAYNFSEENVGPKEVSWPMFFKFISDLQTRHPDWVGSGIGRTDAAALQDAIRLMNIQRENACKVSSRVHASVLLSLSQKFTRLYRLDNLLIHPAFKDAFSDTRFVIDSASKGLKMEFLELIKEGLTYQGLVDEAALAVHEFISYFFKYCDALLTEFRNSIDSIRMDADLDDDLVREKCKGAYVMLLAADTLLTTSWDKFDADWLNIYLYVGRFWEDFLAYYRTCTSISKDQVRKSLQDQSSP